MDPELADPRVVGQHLRRVVRRNGDGFLRGQDVEVVRVQHDPPARPGRDRFPEILARIVCDAVDIHQARMGTRPVADDIARPAAQGVDGEDKAVINGRVTVHKRVAFMEGAQCPVRYAGPALPQPQLDQTRTAPNQDGEGSGCELNMQRTRIAGRKPIELGRAVGDQSRKYIEPSGRALGVREARDGRSQRHALGQFGDIDAAALQHRTCGQVDLVHRMAVDAVRHRARAARQEARPYAPCPPAEPQIQTRRLYLVLPDGRIRPKRTRCGHGAQMLGGQYPVSHPPSGPGLYIGDFVP